MMKAHSAEAGRRMLDLLQYVRSHGPDLTNRQTAIVMVVSWTDGPHTVRALSQLLNVAKPVITRAVSTLVLLGFVERRRDTEDRRNVFITATPALALTALGEDL